MRLRLCALLGPSLLFLCASAISAARVVTGQTDGPSVSWGPDPPLPSWVSVVDARALSVVADLPPVLTDGRHVAADLHGRQAYLAGYVSTGTAIEVIDTALGQIRAVIPLPFAYTLAADPGRARLYVPAIAPAPQIAVLDTRDLAVLPPIALPADTSALEALAGPVVTPDATRLFVSFDNRIFAIRLPQGVVARSTMLDFSPTALAVNQVRNELYVASDTHNRGPIVLDADTLIVKRHLDGFTNVSEMAVRQSDNTLLVTSDNGAQPGTRLDAVDVDSGARRATSRDTGYGVTVSIDGSEIYRLQRGIRAPGRPFADTSTSMVVLDAVTFARKGSVALDTRAPQDPLREVFAVIGTSTAAIPNVSLAVEYYHAGLGHYFTTSLPGEVAALDSGVLPGWQRTGESLPVYAQRDDGPAGTTPVCRFYGLPEKGLDSHFYSASPAECTAVQREFGGSWMLEASEAFDVYAVAQDTGSCPFETTPVYRVYNNRPDANHRYTTSVAIRDSMLQAGWVPEGYGPEAVAFCVPR